MKIESETKANQEIKRILSRPQTLNKKGFRNDIK